MHGAEASQPEDKKNILELIEGTIGNDEFNITGNVFIRDWISSVILSVMEDNGTNSDETSTANYAIKLNIARSLKEMDFPDDTLKTNKKCQAIREKVLGKDV